MEQYLRRFVPMLSRPGALEGSKELRASYTSDSVIVRLLSAVVGVGRLVVEGRIKDVVDNTEWKNLLNRLAFSISEVADTESRYMVKGNELCFENDLIY